MVPNQAREEIHRLVHGAVVGRRPIAAVYDGCRRLLCPHKLGWNRSGQLRALCYQYGGESVSGLQPQNASANWRCLALEKLGAVELLNDPWHSAPNHSQPQTCIERVEVDAEDYPPRAPQNGQ
jgi:hypothetical protein